MTHPLVPIAADTHGVLIALAYATADNIAGRPIYARPLCLLHRDAEPALRRAAQAAAQTGHRIKIFDAFRPQEAQWALWHAAPDKAYVADPAIGSNHTRGTALDLTLVDADGAELDMGTGFDDMTLASHHFSDLVSPAALVNRARLMAIMEGAGFERIPHEWWHYALPAQPDHGLIDSASLGDANPMALLTDPTRTSQAAG